MCTDPDVNGADFYVMDYVEGSVVFDRADAMPSTRRCAR